MRLVGKEFKITFLDHVEDSDEPIICVVYGVCIRNTYKAITLACWELQGEDEETTINNRKSYTIVKSAITETKEIITF